MDKDFSEKLSKIEIVLNKALPQSYTEEWKTNSFSLLNSNVLDFHLNGLVEPCRNLLTLGGKRWRPLLLILCAELTAKNQSVIKSLSKEDEEILIQNAYHLTPLIEFVHTASLIHDDIEDAADMRRGKPAAHITYGVDTAINAASWLYFEAPVCINTLNANESTKNVLYQLYTQELRRLHLGQAMDIAWHRNPSLIPTIGEYKAMVQSKTGTLASLAAQIGIISAGGSVEDAKKAGQIAAQIGVGFQILDDVQNLTTGNPGKKRGDDIVEGKKSLPILLHLQKFPNDKQIIADYMTQARAQGIDSPAVENCIHLLEKSKVISDAFNEGHELVTSKSAELASLYQNTKNNEDVTSPFVRLFTSMLPSV